MRSLMQMRQEAREIFSAGLTAADPYRAVQRHVRLENRRLRIAEKEYELERYRRIRIIGAGKASARMAHALEELLGERVDAGVLSVKYGHAVPLRAVTVREAGHPVPDEAGLRAAREIVELAEKSREDDLIFCLISGGGSALLPCPADGLSLADKQQTTQALLKCGAAIQEINAIRKHISKVKGGRLAQRATPATVVSLILSDVIGDTLDSIASGPTAPDPTTFADCLAILRRYRIESSIPSRVRQLIEDGARGTLPDTPKADDATFQRVQNHIVGSNRLALEAARQKAEALGYHPLVLSSFIEGETRVVAAVHGAIAKEILAAGNPVSAPACVISGGETTVTVQGTGLGGRNQEFALAAAFHIAGLRNVVILSGGTDGTDGPTDAAGAVSDGTTLERAKDRGLDAEALLHDNDAYHFFQPLGDLLHTGPTFTNVMDLRLVLAA